MTLELISSASPTRDPVEKDARPPGLAGRVVTALIVGLPFLALVFGVVRVWGRGIYLSDTVVIDALFPVWCVVSLALPFGLGWLLGGTLGAALSALFWACLVGVCLLHHATWSINSLCHVFGRRPFETKDRRSNVAGLASISMGESWHNGQHAFPRTARYGLLSGQWDSSAMRIRALERMGLLRDVHSPTAKAVRSRSIAVGGQRGPQHRTNVGGP